MEKATIYDYARMCKSYEDCAKCPIAKTTSVCHLCIAEQPDKANEIILKWCKEHPVETRQDRLLKMFPNVIRFENNNIIAIKPCDVDTDYATFPCTLTCEKCFKKYWLAEVEENE